MFSRRDRTNDFLYRINQNFYLSIQFWTTYILLSVFLDNQKFRASASALARNKSSCISLSELQLQELVFLNLRKKAEERQYDTILT